MTDESLKLGVIARRVCLDLLQRLGSAASGLPTTSPTAHTSVTRTQGSSTSSVSIKKEEPEVKVVNGVKGSDEDDDLPPLGGDEDIDKENAPARGVSVTLSSNTFAKSTLRQIPAPQVPLRINVALETPRNQAASDGDGNTAPYRLVVTYVYSIVKTPYLKIINQRDQKAFWEVFTAISAFA